MRLENKYELLIIIILYEDYEIDTYNIDNFKEVTYKCTYYKYLYISFKILFISKYVAKFKNKENLH